MEDFFFSFFFFFFSIFGTPEILAIKLFQDNKKYENFLLIVKYQIR